MRQVTAILLCVLLLSVLVWQGVQYVTLGAAAVSFPFELDYGEGIVWEQSRQIFSDGAYGPIAQFPTVVFHYPPVFHVVARGVAALSGMDGLAAGRLVSIASTFGISATIGTLAAWLTDEASGKAGRLGAALVGSLLVLCIGSVVNWSVLMRVDMLAHLLSLSGLLFGICALRRPLLVIPTATCFLLSVYTKQTSVAAPAAFLGVALWLQPQLALQCLALCLSVGLGVLALLTEGSDGGFLRHVFLYNVNRVDWAQLKALYVLGEQVLPLCLAALLGAAATGVSLRGSGEPALALFRRGRDDHDQQAATFLVLSAYAMMTALMLLAIVKSGAAYNYTIEFTLVLCAFAGAGVARLFAAARISSGVPLDVTYAVRVLAGASLLSAQGLMLVKPYQHRLASPAYRRAMESLSVRIRETSGPVISDDMVLLLRAGKRIELEPAIVTELASVGIWDERAYVRRIEAREFAMIVSEAMPDSRSFLLRHTPTVTAAVLRHYPVRDTLAGLVLSMPAR